MTIHPLWTHEPAGSPLFPCSDTKRIYIIKLVDSRDEAQKAGQTHTGSIMKPVRGGVYLHS